MLIQTDGQNLYLDGCQPHRQCACKFFNDEGKGPLVTADGGTVNDIGILFLTVPIHILHAELFREHLVDLNGDEGVFLSVNILALNVQFGAVEGGFANAYLVFHTQIV